MCLITTDVYIDRCCSVIIKYSKWKIFRFKTKLFSGYFHLNISYSFHSPFKFLFWFSMQNSRSLRSNPNFKPLFFPIFNKLNQNYGVTFLFSLFYPACGSRPHLFIFIYISLFKSYFPLGFILFLTHKRTCLLNTYSLLKNVPHLHFFPHFHRQYIFFPFFSRKSRQSRLYRRARLWFICSTRRGQS